MSTYVSNRDGGKTNEEGHYRFHVKAWTGNVLSGLQAQAKSPLALGVDITTGDVKVDYSGYGYTAWTDAIESVTLTTADPSNPRIDRIVGYIDRGVTPSSAVTNNPGILKFMDVAGTPAGSPSAPNDAAVQSAVGASNPWFSIANVLVGTGVTTISSGNITDTRVFVTATIKDSAVTTAKLADASINKTKVDFTTAGGIWWEELGRTTLGSAGDTLSVTGLTARKYLKVLVTAIATGGTINGVMRFNNDSGANYAKRVSDNSGADATGISANDLYCLANTAAQDHKAIIEITNFTSQEKLAFGHAVGRGTAGAANLPVRNESAGKWTNTSTQITRIDVVNSGTGDYAIGSEIIVLGHD